MSSVSSIGSSYSISALYSKLDSSGKGYFEVSDLETALSGLNSSSSDEQVSAASELFSQLDSDGDGKVTESELTTSMTKLAETLDNQFNMSRMEGAIPPPPPPEEDEGFTEEELASQLEEIGSTDSARSTLISSIVENFDEADADGDGKVSRTEAMSYAESAGLTPANAQTGATAAASDAGFTEDELTSQLEEIGSTDSARSTLISSIIENFDVADTNEDGKVSNAEAMAYAEANAIAPATTSDSASSSSTSSGSESAISDAQVYRQLMDLMRTYGTDDTSSAFAGTLASTISALA